MPSIPGRSLSGAVDADRIDTQRELLDEYATMVLLTAALVVRPSNERKCMSPFHRLNVFNRTPIRACVALSRTHQVGCIQQRIPFRAARRPRPVRRTE